MPWFSSEFPLHRHQTLRLVSAALGVALLRPVGVAAELPLQALAARTIGADQGVYVQARDGTLLAALNESRLVHPASVSKIAATLALLDRLGPDHRFATRISTAGPTVADALQGDLSVESDGDPYFIYESAFLVLGELHRLGVRRVDGELRVDGPLMFNWQPDATGARLRRALSGREGVAAWPMLAVDRPELAGLTPATVGLSFVRSVRPPPAASRRTLLVYRSPPLRAIMKALNCYSNNIFHPLSQTIGGPKEVERITRERLPAGLGNEVVIDNAAGAGLTNRMSPRAAVAIVRALEQEAAEHSLSLSDLLPVAGIDHGTLQKRLDTAALRGAMVGKTGTYGSIEVTSLAGIVHTEKYGDVLFAILNKGVPVASARSRQDAFLEALLRDAGGAPRSYAPPANPISLASVESGD